MSTFIETSSHSLLPADLGVLVVEDNPGDYALTKVYLQQAGVQEQRIHHAPTLQEAVCACNQQETTVVLLDLNLPDSMGLDTLKSFQSSGCTCPVVLLTGNDEDVFGLDAVASGAQDFISKASLSPSLLRRTLRYAIERYRLLQEKEDLVLQLQDALDNVKTLKGIVPICAKCKKVRDEHGNWVRVEEYISERTDADFSHSLCPECLEEYYEDLKKIVPGFQPITEKEM